MKQIRQLLLMLASSLAAALCPAQEVGVIRWQVIDMPPAFSFIKGHPPKDVDDLGNGEVDGFMRLLIGQMPQYRHEFVEAGVGRFEALAKQDRAVCSMLLVRTPQRLEWLFYTPVYPPLISRQIHVIVRRGQLAKFSTPQGQVLQLSDILKRRDLVGLLQKDRSYGPRIDALVEAQGTNAPRFMTTARNTQLLSMLNAGRMDYTLEYPSMLDAFEHKDGSAADLVALPIAEGASTSMAHVACSRNPEGRRAIEAIDRAERQLAQDPRRETLLRGWMDESPGEVDRPRLKRFMDERAKAGPRIE